MADDAEDTQELGPVTLEEWQTYVDGLTDDQELHDVAIGAGTLAFGRKLLAEGYSAADVTTIRTMIAKKMADEGLAPPTRVAGCVVDYRDLVPKGTFTF